MALAFLSSGNYANLSWQDHTVTTEVMLFPVRNQLLMKKHQTLNSKCKNEMKLYDKEKEAMIKRVTIDKRMMERKKQALYRRRSEILLHRVSGGSSASVSVVAGRSTPEKRGKSAPARCEWDDKNITEAQQGVFLTETPAQSAPTYHHNLSGQNKDAALTPEPLGVDSVSDSISVHVPSASVAFSPSSRRVISPCHGKMGSTMKVKSVRFHGGLPIQETLETTNHFGSAIPLEERIKMFNENIKEFNERPLSGSCNKYGNALGSSRKTLSHSPLIAKKYTTLTLDTKKLENAFDKFCIDKSKDDLDKLVRMATKMRSNVNLARNQSMIPTIAGYKGSKAFKLLIKKENKS